MDAPKKQVKPKFKKQIGYALVCEGYIDHAINGAYYIYPFEESVGHHLTKCVTPRKYEVVKVEIKKVENVKKG